MLCSGVASHFGAITKKEKKFEEKATLGVASVESVFQSEFLNIESSWLTTDLLMDSVASAP